MVIEVGRYQVCFECYKTLILPLISTWVKSVEMPFSPSRQIGKDKKGFRRCAFALTASAAMKRRPPEELIDLRVRSIRVNSRPFAVGSSLLADFVFNVFDTDSDADTDPDGGEKPELRKQRITNND